MHPYFRLVIRAGNNPTPSPRNGNVAGQEVREPCLVRVLVCMNEDCHRNSSALFGWCREKGPPPRSIGAANGSELTYTHNADRLILFWRLRDLQELRVDTRLGRASRIRVFISLCVHGKNFWLATIHARFSGSIRCSTPFGMIRASQNSSSRRAEKTIKLNDAVIRKGGTFDIR